MDPAVSELLFAERTSRLRGEIDELKNLRATCHTKTAAQCRAEIDAVIAAKEEQYSVLTAGSTPRPQAVRDLNTRAAFLRVATRGRRGRFAAR